MKVTRSYWLGLGSGLILSAMMALIFTPPREISDVQPVIQTQDTLPLKEENQDSPSLIPSTAPTPKQDVSSEGQVSIQVDRDFVIPKGASAERIAELLFAQGFIKDQSTFLNTTHQMRVERQFRAGTFSLSLGLTEEELIHRLLK